MLTIFCFITYMDDNISSKDVQRKEGHEAVNILCCTLTQNSENHSTLHFVHTATKINKQLPLIPQNLTAILNMVKKTMKRTMNNNTNQKQTMQPVMHNKWVII